MSFVDPSVYYSTPVHSVVSSLSVREVTTGQSRGGPYVHNLLVLVGLVLVSCRPRKNPFEKSLYQDVPSNCVMEGSTWKLHLGLHRMCVCSEAHTQSGRAARLLPRLHTMDNHDGGVQVQSGQDERELP